MADRGMSRANQNKLIRQEALRDQLANQGHLQHIVDLMDQLRDLNVELDATKVARLKIVIDSKLKLLDKYLPTLKAVEYEGNLGLLVRRIDLTGAQPEDAEFEDLPVEGELVGG